MDNIQDFHLVWGTVYFCTGIQSTKKRLKSNKNADFSRFWRFRNLQNLLQQNAPECADFGAGLNKKRADLRRD
ncbi:hypothetical protein [Neisseria perflava]|uniref:hypothetical protein n=1 Tax=Neisseria perflava TaxID=33053 RepID=UPI0020A0E077|nr:hypothetical protein [Neisseria perflava]MCP1659296.1 hypothetical protein [Neisseria perflava]